MPIPAHRKLISNLEAAEALLREEPELLIFGDDHARKIERLIKSIEQKARRVIAENRKRWADE